MYDTNTLLSVKLQTKSDTNDKIILKFRGYRVTDLSTVPELLDEKVDRQLPVLRV